MPKEVVQQRFDRLIALQNRITAEENQKQVGTQQELLVTADSGSKGSETGRLTGRAPDNRLVHFSVPEGAEIPRPGDFVTVPITDAGGHHLLADPSSAEQYSLSASQAGEAWDRWQADSCGVGTTQVSGDRPGSVSLGMPSLRIGS